MPPAVELEHVSKRYRLGGGRGLLQSMLGDGRNGEDLSLWALDDVSLAVEAGESVGLIGHNGAGKTTALRLLAGITRPTRGSVRTRGRVASLINLGAGFHPELTGRENVFLNGVILGLSRREVQQRFDDIVDFAELGSAIDTPLKRYSSGMYARLGFAVAVHVDPDVLLVDEVLSVGNVAFQDRSIRRMLSFRDSGRSVLFVSHNLSAVEMMCERAVWLERGRVRLAGPTANVVRAYLDAVDEGLVEKAGDTFDADSELAVVIAEATTHAGDGQQRTEFEHGQPLRVRLQCVARQDLSSVACEVTVRGDYGPLFSAIGPTAELWSRGRYVAECTFASLPLLPGLYRVDARIRHRGTGGWELPRTVAAFRVATPLEAYGSDSVVAATKSRGGFLMVDYAWQIDSRALPGLHRPVS